MKDYFKRNSPIFYIGLFTTVLFLAIIFAASNNNDVTPSLDQVKDEDLYTSQNPVIGDSSARVTIVEFSDYNCPFCVSVNPVLKSTIDNNPGKIRLIVRHLPLGIPGHESSKEAAIASTAAIKFGKFKEMHDEIYLMKDKSRENLVSLAERLGMNRDEFIKSMESEETLAIVNSDMEAASKLNIRSTPTIFINGKLANPSQDLVTQILSEMNKMYPQN